METFSAHETSAFLGARGSRIRQICLLAQQDLQNFFGTEVIVRVSVIPRHEPSPKSKRETDEIDQLFQ